MSNAYEVAPRRQPSKPRGIFDCEPEEEMHMTEEEKRIGQFKGRAQVLITRVCPATIPNLCAPSRITANLYKLPRRRIDLLSPIHDIRRPPSHSINPHHPTSCETPTGSQGVAGQIRRAHLHAGRGILSRNAWPPEEYHERPVPVGNGRRAWPSRGEAPAGRAADQEGRLYSEGPRGAPGSRACKA